MGNGEIQLNSLTGQGAIVGEMCCEMVLGLIVGDFEFDSGVGDFFGGQVFDSDDDLISAGR